MMHRRDWRFEVEVKLRFALTVAVHEGVVALPVSSYPTAPIRWWGWNEGLRNVPGL
jgi:hypothetical protein